MKISEQWLREWVNPRLTTSQLAEKLTMAGLEVEEVKPVAGKFSKVVIAQVIKIEKHPQADRLKVCLVDIGKGILLTIVCGADNVREGMKTPAALEHAQLANDIVVKRATLRGVISYGMLCSAKELGLSEENSGLLELPLDAPLGKDVWEYLQLSDNVFDISITPNRGDCLSVMGLAKEISAITQSSVRPFKVKNFKVKNEKKFSLAIKSPKECPRYVGRIIRKIKADAISPIWLQERLRRSGLRCISLVVDVMNYVMLELGQPMHAFDLSKIEGGITIRKAKTNEELLLLDGTKSKLNSNTLVVADHKKPLAIAGVMGGLDSGVSLLTKDVFLESAYFNSDTIAETSRHYRLTSESSYRFERGIDPGLQKIAIERATQLILEISGGEPAPIIEIKYQKLLPHDHSITLNKKKVVRLLGIDVQKEVEPILKRLDCKIKKIKEGWKVITPARRSDISLDVDLIEEIIRLHGYQKVPSHLPSVKLKPVPLSEKNLSHKCLRHTLSGLGYQEVVTYSFIDEKLLNLFDVDNQPVKLLNPITSEMNVMRTSLWPGLVNTLLYNQNRQQPGARLFEIGLRYLIKNNKLHQQTVISGLINGPTYPLQWGQSNRDVDFFDLKGDLESLFKLTGALTEFNFVQGTHSALNPSQAAQIKRGKEAIGWIGALHPSLIKNLGIHGNTYVFELLLDPLLNASVPLSAEVSRFPEIRRDIAILVDKTIPFKEIQDTIINVGGDLLKDVAIFDIYEGKGMTPNQKSIALALTLQHSSRTLIDEEVVALMDRVKTALENKFAAVLRG